MIEDWVFLDEPVARWDGEDPKGGSFESGQLSLEDGVLVEEDDDWTHGAMGPGVLGKVFEPGRLPMESEGCESRFPYPDGIEDTFHEDQARTARAQSAEIGLPTLWKPIRTALERRGDTAFVVVGRRALEPQGHATNPQVPGFDG